MLTAKQIEIIKASVPVLMEHGVALTSNFYARMMRENPELRQVFNQAHQRTGKQQASLAGAVLAYAQHIENPAVLLGAVEHIAHKHVSVGIRAEHYPIVGKHLLAAIKELLGDAATDEFIGAWAAAYGQLADILIGVESGLYNESANAEGGWSGWRAFRVVEKKVETDLVTSFTLAPADGGRVMAVEPGQYVSVRVFVKSEGMMQPRQYTVSGADEGFIRISVKRVAAGDTPAGMVSNTLHNDVQVGDLIDVAPPQGEFRLTGEKTPVVLISAGIGVTPMVAMMKAAVREDRPTTFCHVARDTASFPLKGEVEEDMRRLTDGRLVVRFTADEGRPTAADVATVVRPGADYYICGPESFMTFVADALKEAGVEREHIRAEKFGTGMLAL